MPAISGGSLATLESKMPDLKARVGKVAFREVNYYWFGSDFSGPCFWLRIVFPLIATEFQEPNVEKQLFSSQNKDIRHKLVDICYCKKHLLGRSNSKILILEQRTAQ